MKLRIGFLCLITLAGLSASCKNKDKDMSEIKPMENQKEVKTGVQTDTATFGAGCFWCVEAVSENLKGVKTVTSGYSGGHVENPDYALVCSGTTGHAEVIQVVYDPNVISYPDLLEAFWSSHDPTTLNRQGADVGTQYRSVIFYHNDEQRKLAEEYKAQLDKSGAFARPIVTQIVPFKKFYKAENYHQQYYDNNKEAPYCQYVIRPKLEKFRQKFGDKMKK
jgi:peptide-methionine (S)-S-oxide reductase